MISLYSTKILPQIFEQQISPFYQWIQKLQFKFDFFEIVVLPKHTITLLQIFKNHNTFAYKTLIDIVATDNPSRNRRFTLSYLLLTVKHNNRVQLSTAVDNMGKVPTASLLYQSANWSEREVWDLFGIIFLEHTDLRRILTDYGFKGYPLRKDYPVVGFVETAYSNVHKLVRYKLTELAQIGHVPTRRNTWVCLDKPYFLSEEEDIVLFFRNAVNFSKFDPSEDEELPKLKDTQLFIDEALQDIYEIVPQQ